MLNLFDITMFTFIQTESVDQYCTTADPFD